MTRFELDPGARRLSHGRVLLGGSPLSMFRLTDAGSRIVERIAAGEELTAGHEALTDRLVATGAIHPVPTGADGPTAAEVTLVVPAYGADPTRVALIASATGAGRTIVVDDASTSAFPARPGLEVIRRGANGGPGAARQTGLDANV